MPDADIEALVRERAARYANSPDEVERLVEQTLARLAWRRRRGHKVCDQCKQTKKPDAFGADTRNRDGLHRVCRECRSSVNRERLS